MVRAYRFLNEEYALQAIRDRRLRISRFDQLNDPLEWAPPANASREQRQAFGVMKKEMGEDRGLICFSRSWSNPLLWSHYADKHQGIALGFDFHGNQHFEVVYRKDRIPCDWERFQTDKQYAFKITDLVLRSKSDHWSYEEEVRAHVALDHSTVENTHYFFNFGQEIQLREIVLGPLCKLRRSDLALIRDDIENDVTFKKARLAFRSYNVVEQKNKTTWA